MVLAVKNLVISLPILLLLSTQTPKHTHTGARTQSHAILKFLLLSMRSIKYLKLCVHTVHNNVFFQCLARQRKENSANVNVHTACTYNENNGFENGHKWKKDYTFIMNPPPPPFYIQKYII